MYVKVTWILWPKVFSKTSHRSLYCSVLTLACPLKATEVVGDSQKEYSVHSVGENYDALCDFYITASLLFLHICWNLEPLSSVQQSSCINFGSTCGDALTMFSIILSLVKVIQKIMRAYLFLLQELMMNIFKLVKHFNVQRHFVHLVKTNLSIFSIAIISEYLHHPQTGFMCLNWSKKCSYLLSMLEVNQTYKWHIHEKKTYTKKTKKKPIS